MDKKDDMETLIKQYLSFYQRDSQKIELNQGSDFDDLMHQYKTKFDKQIANEQKAMREKENARIIRKKQELELKTQQKEQEKQNRKLRESLKNTKKDPPKPNNSTSKTKNNKTLFRQKYQRNNKNYQNNNHKSLILLIVTIAIVGFIFVATSNQEQFDIFKGETNLNEQLNETLLKDAFNSGLDYVDNNSDLENFTRALPYLAYNQNSKDYLDLINITLGSDDFLMIDNNSDRYLYLSYSSNGSDTNILVVPNTSYYDIFYDNNEILINAVGFYDYTYPLPELGADLYIGSSVLVDNEYVTSQNAQEVFKYYYYRTSLDSSYDHNNEVTTLCQLDSNKGYYGYLDYSNHQISIYYNDDDSMITIENIQDYQSKLIQTITL